MNSNLLNINIKVKKMGALLEDKNYSKMSNNEVLHENN